VIKYAASYYVSYYVCEFRILKLCHFFKTFDARTEKPRLESFNYANSNQIGKENPLQTVILKAKRSLTNV
jgi:hypothetical protein